MGDGTKFSERHHLLLPRTFTHFPKTVQRRLRQLSQPHGPGFGLENYDVLGRWRTQDEGKPKDTQGVLADGQSFDGPDQLKKVLLGKKDLFVTNLTSKMLAALGRGLTIEDQCTVGQVVNQLAKSDYSAHKLIRKLY